MPYGSIPRSKSGKTWDYLKNRSNIGRPFRAVKGLMDDPPSLTGPIRKEDIERSFDAAGLASAGSMAGKRPPNSVGTGGRQYKVSGATSKVKVTPPKAGDKKFIGPVNQKPRSAKDYQSSGSLRRSFLERADSGDLKAARAPRPGEKKFIGPENKPSAGDKKFIGPTQPPKAGDKNFIGPRRPPKSGDSDFIGPVGRAKSGMSGKTKLAIGAGAGAAALAGYKAAQKPKAEEKRSFGNKDSAKPKNSSGYSGYGNKTTSAAYGSSAKKEPSSEPKGDIKTPTINNAAPTSGAANSAKDKIKRQLQGTNPDKKAGDKSSQAGRTAKQVVQGGASKRGMTFQEATRRNRSDEYLKERMRPKKNLLDLFKKKR